MRRILREIAGGAAFIVACFGMILLLLLCSGHRAEAATWESLGTHRLTFYCNCQKCCGAWAGGPTASGRMPERYRTIAVSTSEIPLNSTVYIDGFGFRVAEDTGVSAGTIDIYCPDHQMCLDLGVKHREVWLVKGDIDE